MICCGKAIHWLCEGQPRRWSSYDERRPGCMLQYQKTEFEPQPEINTARPSSQCCNCTKMCQKSNKNLFKNDFIIERVKESLALQVTEKTCHRNWSFMYSPLFSKLTRKANEKFEGWLHYFWPLIMNDRSPGLLKGVKGEDPPCYSLRIWGKFSIFRSGGRWKKVIFSFPSDKL